MNRNLRLIFGCVIVGTAGCAAKPSAFNPHHSIPIAAAVPVDPKAQLTIDQIEPAVSIATPATVPSGEAPLAAIQLYAQARAMLVDNQKFKAISLLEQAGKLDPQGYEIFYDLGRAYLMTSASGSASDRAIVAFEKAAAIQPDHLELHYDLGRQYLDRNDLARALSHLRMSRLTSDYQNEKNVDAAAMVDFFLARALRQSGYVGAALTQYDTLLNRLSRTGLTQRSNPELVYFLKHPQILYTEIGELYEKKGSYTEALKAYELALENDKENSELGKRIIRMKLRAGRLDDAKVAAAALVLSTHGTAESINLLKEMYSAAAQPEKATDALAKLHAEHPADRLIFYALLDQLKLTGRASEAEKLLVAAARDSNSDPDYIHRLFLIYMGRNDINAAMRLLVDSLADRPDSLREIGPLWGVLLRPARRGRLRLSALQQMQVPAREEAARLFWVSRLAEIWNRDALARATLQQAAELKPAFPPVYRWLILENWSKPDWDEKQKAAACQRLVDIVESQGNGALAAELHGRSLLMQDDAEGAAKAFATSQALGNRSPDLQLMHARAILKQGNEVRAEQLLGKLLNDWPRFEEAYSDLFSMYLQRRAVDQALGVLHKWLSAVPSSVDARLLEAAIDAQVGQPEGLSAAKAILQSLFDEQPDNLEVLRAIQTFQLQHGKLDDFIAQLEAERLKNPDNREAVEMLVSIYVDQKRLPEASQVLDAAKNAVAHDPDLLYYVAHLYERIDQKPVTERMLEEIVGMDPHHAAASNDLGYAWADEGKNLDRAEALVRVAVEAEPDNQSYLDSMAWVEYKRGKFAEARGFLNRAIGPANRPDPVVLDHLGDTMYRLEQPTEAVKQWKRSLQRLTEAGAEREDLKDLRQQLLAKLKQQEQGKPVHVAPVAEMPKKSTQAKN